MDVAKAARAGLDALKQQAAERTGTTASAVNLNHVNYASFSDQDLAAMKLNPTGDFSEDEQIQAAAMLNERLRVSLETYRGVTELGDRRGHTMTIKALYSQMTPEIRSAMNWTPAMMAETDYLLALDEGKFGKLPAAGVLANLQATQSAGGIRFDGSQFTGWESTPVSAYRTMAAKGVQEWSSSSTVPDNATLPPAGDAVEPSFREVGLAARAKLDMLKQQSAEKTGTTAGSVNLNHVDYSSFSDQDLAAMNLNSSGNFSEEERQQAQGVLGERMRVSLETYRGVTELGDRRGHTMTIDALYKQMSPEVRNALGWTPVMMAQNDYLMALDEGKFGKLPFSGVLANLQATQAEGGLEFDMEQMRPSKDLTLGSYQANAQTNSASISNRSDSVSGSPGVLNSTPNSAEQPDHESGPGQALILSRLFGSTKAPPVALPGSDNPVIGAYLTEEDRALIVKMYDYSVEHNIDLNHVDALAIDLGLHRMTPDLIRDAELYDLSGRRMHVAFSEADRAAAERIAKAAPASSIDQSFLRALQLPGGHSVNFEFLERMVCVFSTSPATLNNQIEEYDPEKNRLVVTVDEEVTLHIPVADFAYDGTSKTWTIRTPAEKSGQANDEILRMLQQRSFANEGYLGLLLGYAHANNIEASRFRELLSRYSQ